jgi:outer membrane protein OmpA-like peptidoglycan-associated protein
MRKSLLAASLLALTVAVAPACATKKFVRTEVGNVNGKVDTLTGTVEETQERTRRNEERIGAVDQKAEAAGKSATEARAAADAAATAAKEFAKDADTKVTTVNNRVNAVEAASRRLIYEVTLSEDQGNFAFNKTTLPDEAKARLDKMVADLKADPKGIYIEIEGHTDNRGTPEVNEKIGMERAEAVKRYLYEQHQVPLHKINVISYGEEKPVAPNNTRDGRAQNRRVVIKVLS